MKSCILITSLAALILTPPPLHAGSGGSTTLTTAYQSRYVLYGYRLNHHLVSADVYHHQPANERLSFWGGGWFGALPDGTYRELDLYGGLDVVLSDALSAGLTYSLFNYLEVPYETSDHVSEFAVSLAASAGPLRLELRDHYDTEAEGHLLRAILSAGHSVADAWYVHAKVETGYAIDYFIEGQDWNHANAEVALTFQATDAIGITPFLAHSTPLSAIDAFEKDQTYGGLRLSATF